MACGAPLAVWDLPAVGRRCGEEDIPPPLLGFSPRPGRRRPARREREDERVEVVQVLLPERVGAGQHLGEPGPALDPERRVLPRPLDRLGPREPVEVAVVDDVAAHAVDVEVVGQAVREPVRMARAAGELSPERGRGARGNPLSAPDQVVAPAVSEDDPSDRLEGPRVDGEDRVLEALGDPERAAVWAQRDLAGVEPCGDAGHDGFRRKLQVGGRGGGWCRVRTRATTYSGESCRSSIASRRVPSPAVSSQRESRSRSTTVTTSAPAEAMNARFPDGSTAIPEGSAK